MTFRLVQFETPKNLSLKGVWLGAEHPENLFILIHGLGGSLFSRAALSELLASRRDAVLAFNNRGSGTINYFKAGRGVKKKYFLAGVAHEVFTDCVDDIDGALAYAQTRGAKRIFLIGHSTGCQKSVYYLSKRPQAGIKGAILLAPMSDYSDITRLKNKSGYRRALAAAKRLVKAGQPHALLPSGLWPAPLDAQRFLSLYTPDSLEEIFTYASGKTPAALLKVNKPLLIVLAESDEFGDRPVAAIRTWFDTKLAGRKHYHSLVIAAADHFFIDCEAEMAKRLRSWVKGIN